MASYFNLNKPDLKNSLLAPLIRQIDYIPCASERESLLLERRLIQLNQPFFNVMWKDGKTYPYLKITMNEDFPRLLLTRRKLGDGALYFGPYPKVSPIRGLLNYLWRHGFFPLRPCRWEFSADKPLDPKKITSCLYYHTRECPAPCASKISPEAYREMFGRLGGAWIMNLRFDNVFSSFWFLALMAGGALNMLACTVKQWKVLRLRPGVFLSHLGIMLMCVGCAVQGVFTERGVLALETGQVKGEFAGRKGTAVSMPFEVLLKNFRIQYWDQEKHIVHALKKCADPGHVGEDLLESVEVEPGKDAHFKSEAADLSVIKFYPNFSIGDSGPVTLDEARANPALAVKLKDSKPGKPHPSSAKPTYLFANHPDFHGAQDAAGVRYVYEYNPGRVKQFESRIAFLEGGVEKFENSLMSIRPATRDTGFTGRI